MMTINDDDDVTMMMTMMMMNLLSHLLDGGVEHFEIQVVQE